MIRQFFFFNFMWKTWILWLSNKFWGKYKIKDFFYWTNLKKKSCMEKRFMEVFDEGDFIMVEKGHYTWVHSNIFSFSSTFLIFIFIWRKIFLFLLYIITNKVHLQYFLVKYSEHQNKKYYFVCCVLKKNSSFYCEVKWKIEKCNENVLFVYSIIQLKLLWSTFEKIFRISFQFNNDFNFDLADEFQRGLLENCFNVNNWRQMMLILGSLLIEILWNSNVLQQLKVWNYFWCFCPLLSNF